MIPPLPITERPAVVDQNRLPDTLPREEFDDLVRLAVHLCSTPLTAVSLIDDHRRWFNAITGMSAAQTPRDAVFRTQAILESEMTVALESQTDPRFVDRTLSPEQEAALRVLARQASSRIKSARQVAALERLLQEKEKADEERQRLASIVESSEDAMLCATLDGTILTWNRAAERLYGYGAAEVIGRDAAFLAGPDQPSPVSAAVTRLVRGEAVDPAELVRTRKDGTRFHASLKFSPIHDAAGSLAGFSCIAHDITQRKQVEAALAASQARLAEAQRVAKIGSWEYDLASGAITWSQEMFRLVGRDEALGEPDYGANLAQYHPEDAALLAALVSRAVGHGEDYEIDLRLADEGGSGPTQWRHAIGSVARGEEGQVVRLLGTFADITERKQADERLREYAVLLEAQKNELEAQKNELERANTRLEELATTDGLTGLKNHRTFQERLEEHTSLAARHGTPLSLVLLDVDHFKQINDGFGHLAGDEVLRTVAGVLLETARDGDIAARYGGEEFVLVLPHTDQEGALALAERLRASLEARPWTSRSVTASIGVASLQPGDRVCADLIARADVALYHSKIQGRNRVTSDCATRAK